MDNGIDYKRIASLSCCTLLSATALLIPTRFLTNTDIYTDLLTVISILCGVLIAAISILGTEPNKISSQTAILHDHSTESKMVRLRLQFYLYLLVVAMALLCKLMNGEEGCYSILLYKTTALLGAFAILTSFNLPRLLSDAFKHTRVR